MMHGRLALPDNREENQMAKSTNVARIHAALNRLDQKANVSGFVVIDSACKHVGTVRFSYPRDGAGKLVALAADWSADRPRDAEGKADFSNWTPWQYGTANGGGYDKHTAAMSGMTIAGVVIKDDGHRWNDQLRAAGLTVLQAV